MKKSLIALAVLGAFAGAASAQSSVTIYGKVNVELGKNFKSEDKTMLDSAGSRLGFKGVEDLGGGMAATFGIEHRFTPATGADASGGTKFWNGYSTVGLQGAFGHVRVGRDYTPAFLMIQNQVDPFGGDTVGALRNTGMLVSKVANGNATIGKVRSDSMVEYHFSTGGLNLGAQVAGANENGGTNKAWSLAANYAAGPLFIGAGYENPTGEEDKVFNIGARYNLGFATLSAGYSKGTTAAGTDLNGWLIGANVPVGAGDFKIGYAQASEGLAKKVGVGYHYNLSKRTKVFADYGHDSKVVGPKTGYDVGVQHNF